MKDHEIRELVNQLRDIAIKYHGTGQLRERIAHVVRAAMLQEEKASKKIMIMPLYGASYPIGIAPMALFRPSVTPDGYVMVPIKPTMEILDEFDSIIDYGAEDSEDAWRRLLAAAPKEVKGE